MAITVVLVDDQALVRSGLRVLLDNEPDLEVLAEAQDGAEAVERVLELKPDVVVMDVQMPEVDGIEATRRIVAAGSPSRVLVLTTFDADRAVYDALRAGAAGFLLKDAPPERLTEAVRTVAAGEALLAPEVTRRMVERFVSAAPPADVQDDTFAALTPRELDVVRLVARGMSNVEVGAELQLGEATVKTHVTSVLRKLGLRDRTQVVVLAYERGLVQPGDASG